MENMPLKKRKTNHRNKHKLKNQKRKNTKQKKFKIEIISKYAIIFILITFDINLYSLHMTLPLLFNETEAFREILSFEKNINLSDDIFYEFLKINEQNKLIEENIKFVRAKKPDVSVVMLIYNMFINCGIYISIYK